MKAAELKKRRSALLSSKMGKCIQITHFLNISGISLKNPQANLLTRLIDKKMCPIGPISPHSPIWTCYAGVWRSCGRTNKATRSRDMQNCVPAPRQARNMSHQGLWEPKVTGFSWEYAKDDVWNQQDESVPSDALRRCSGRPRGYRQSRDVS